MELSDDILALKDLVSVLLRRIEVLESENAALRVEVADLRSRLNLNSKNSHKPPSSDGLSKKPGLPKGPPPKQGKRGKPKNSKGRNLLNRLLNHQDGWLAFAFINSVPFSNNQAERDIRCLKTKQKVATNFQTFKGAQHYARIQSFTSTLRKHSMNVFQNLINAFDRKPIAFQAG